MWNAWGGRTICVICLPYASCLLCPGTVSKFLVPRAAVFPRFAETLVAVLLYSFPDAAEIMGEVMNDVQWHWTGHKEHLEVAIALFLLSPEHSRRRSPDETFLGHFIGERARRGGGSTVERCCTSFRRSGTGF